VWGSSKRGAAGRGEGPALLVAEVGLGRFEVGPVRLGFEAFGCNGDDVVGDALTAGFAQQALDDHLVLGVRLRRSGGVGCAARVADAWRRSAGS
jgi:hypothetical protein